jgi:transketolase
VIYEPDQLFVVGGSRVLRDGDDVTLVGAGVTLHEALKAADRLAAAHDVHARVIDLYSVKPVDTEMLARAAAETGGLVTVEDHWPEGGLGDAVLAALADAGQDAPVRKLAVRGMPGSGTPAELLHEAGIDADVIAQAALEHVRERAVTR